MQIKINYKGWTGALKPDQIGVCSIK